MLIMITTILYYVEAGIFETKNGQPKFYSPELMIPLVKNTRIGVASNAEEMELCNGGLLGEIKDADGNIEYGVTFSERANYNGKKIIIPLILMVNLARISQNHGELRRVSDRMLGDFLYYHDCDSATALWTPEEGLIRIVNSPNTFVNLKFHDIPHDASIPYSDRYLLLGNNKDLPEVERLKKLEGIKFDDIYPLGSYYLRIRETNTWHSSFLTDQ